MLIYYNSSIICAKLQRLKIPYSHKSIGSSPISGIFYLNIYKMKKLHLKTSANDSGLLYLKKIPNEEHTYWSGKWDIKFSVAKTLIGGMIFLHKEKSKKSTFGGKVLDVREVEYIEGKRTQRVEFKIKSMVEGRDVKWEGKDHSMAYSGGIIDT